jgi:hypothetical protein
VQWCRPAEVPISNGFTISQKLLPFELKITPAPTLSTPTAIEPPSAPTLVAQLPAASTATSTDVMSIAELRCALQNEKDVVLQSVLYKELKRRDREAAAAQKLAAKNRLLAHNGPTTLAIAPQPPTTPRDPNLGAPPIEPSPPFPKSNDAPVPIQAILDQMSVDELKMQLAGKLDPLRLTLTYRELKKRQQLVNF